MITRDELGRIVRETWIAYCLETGDTKPSHLAPYDELSEWDKEADRRIGETIWRLRDNEIARLEQDIEALEGRDYSNQGIGY